MSHSGVYLYFIKNFFGLFLLHQPAKIPNPWLDLITLAIWMVFRWTIMDFLDAEVVLHTLHSDFFFTWLHWNTTFFLTLNTILLWLCIYLLRLSFLLVSNGHSSHFMRICLGFFLQITLCFVKEAVGNIFKQKAHLDSLCFCWWLLNFFVAKCNKRALIAFHFCCWMRSFFMFKTSLDGWKNKSTGNTKITQMSTRENRTILWMLSVFWSYLNITFRTG